MPRLSGSVNDLLFAAMDVWRTVKRKNGAGPKWNRAEAIQKTSLTAIALEATNNAALAEGLAEAGIDLSEYLETA